MDYILFSLIILLLSTVRLRNKANEMSNKSLLSVRGICAIAVVLHHIEMYISGKNIRLFRLFDSAGYLCVSVFFAISGFALSYQHKNKNNYLNGFLKKRLSLLLTPYTIATVLYFLTKLLLSNGDDNTIFGYINSTVKGYSVGERLLPFSWYVDVILILYLMFYLIYKYLGNNKYMCYFTCFVGLSLLNYILKQVGYGNYWYNTNYAFLLGILYFDYYESKYYQKLSALVGIIISFVCFAVGVLGQHILSPLIFTQITACAFATFIFQMLRVFKFKSKVLDYLGSRSYEIYLCQGFSILLLNEISLKQPTVFFIVTIVLTIIFAEILHKVSTLVLVGLHKEKMK